MLNNDQISYHHGGAVYQAMPNAPLVPATIPQTGYEMLKHLRNDIIHNLNWGSLVRQNGQKFHQVGMFLQWIVLNDYSFSFINFLAFVYCRFHLYEVLKIILQEVVRGNIFDVSQEQW